MDALLKETSSLADLCFRLDALAVLSSSKEVLRTPQELRHHSVVLHVLQQHHHLACSTFPQELRNIQNSCVNALHGYVFGSLCSRFEEALDVVLNRSLDIVYRPVSAYQAAERWRQGHAVASGRRKHRRQLTLGKKVFLSVCKLGTFGSESPCDLLL